MRRGGDNEAETGVEGASTSARSTVRVMPAAAVAAVAAGVVLVIALLVLRKRLLLRDARRRSAQAQAASKRKPGWYPDPFDGSGERFWNGAHWTGEVLRRDPSASPGSRGRRG
jgi:hypothetical protein